MSDEVAVPRMPPRDVLGTPDPERATRSAGATSRRTRTLVGLALVLLVLGAAADRWVADRERTALLAGVEEGEAALSAARDSQLSLAQYAGRLLYEADVSEPARRSALAVLAQDAARWQPRLQSRQEAVAAQDVLPWHGELRTAREAYAARLGVWIDVLAEVEQEREVLTDVLDGDVRSSRERAERALLEAGLDAADVRSALAGGSG